MPTGARMRSRPVRLKPDAFSASRVAERDPELARIFHQATPVCLQVRLCSQSKVVWFATK